MTTTSRRKLASRFIELWDSFSQKELITWLAREMHERGDKKQVDLLMNDMKQQLFEQKKHLEVTVTSAHPLTKTSQKHIESWLKERYGAETVHCQWQENPEIIGGSIIETPFHRFQFDVASRLNTLMK